MASFVYTGAKERIAKADADFDSLDVRALLVMTNTTADTDQDAVNLDDITTLDEYDGSGYSRADLASIAVTRDDANDRAEVSVDPFTFGSTVAAGTRQAQAILYYVHVDGTAANDWPLAYVDSGGFPFAGNGGEINVTPNAEGILQVG